MILTLDADPYPYTFDPATTAFVVIDMQRDFVEPGGFGETLGNDVSLLQAVVPPLQKAMAAARAAGLTEDASSTSMPVVSTIMRTRSSSGSPPWVRSIRSSEESSANRSRAASE